MALEQKKHTPCVCLFLFLCGYFLFPHFSSSAFLPDCVSVPFLTCISSPFLYPLFHFSTSHGVFPLLISAAADAWVMRISVVLNMKWWGGPRRGGINKSHYLSSLMMQPPTTHLLLSPHTTPCLSPFLLAIQYWMEGGYELSNPKGNVPCRQLPSEKWPHLKCVFARRCVDTKWVESLT